VFFPAVYSVYVRNTYMYLLCREKNDIVYERRQRTHVFVTKNGVDRMKYSCSYIMKSSYPAFSLCFCILCQYFPFARRWQHLPAFEICGHDPECYSKRMNFPNVWVVHFSQLTGNKI